MHHRPWSTRAKLWFALLLTSCVVACGGHLAEQSGRPGQGRARHLPRVSLGEVAADLGATLDPALTEDEIAQLGEDLHFARSLQLDTARDELTGRYVELAFGPSAREVARFLDERIGFVLSSTSSFLNLGPQDNPTTMASNLSAGLFAASRASGTRSMRILGVHARIDSTRVGVIQLGRGYVEALSPVSRLGTLIHEARHSDCSEPWSDEELERYVRGGQFTNQRCGYRHVACPAGHELVGESACDGIPWGAYSIQAVYALGVYRSCSTCTESERQAALMTYLDRSTRYSGFTEMVRDRAHGDPDLSSVGERSR